MQILAISLCHHIIDFLVRFDDLCPFVDIDLLCLANKNDKFF